MNDRVKDPDITTKTDPMDVIKDNNSDDDDDDELDDDDWDETYDDVIEESPIQCLFEKNKCDLSFSSIENAILHLKQAHNLDFLLLKLLHSLDCYSFIKLINYIRKHNLSSEEVSKQIETCKGNTFPWSSDDYMKPHLHDDPWLMYDYDDIEESLDESVPLEGIHHINVERGRITMTQKHYASLQGQIEKLKEELAQKSRTMDIMKEDIDSMKRLMMSNVDSSTDKGNGESKSQHHDRFYFNSYEDAHIHAEMIKDSVRTESYKKAILNNRPLFENKHVLDVGAGTGILSIFAVQAGASKVYAIEKSDIAYETIDIVRKNNFNDKIEVFHKLLEDVELPVHAVDVIISEWMGYFLLFETMIDSVIYARDTFLKPGGIVCPNRFTLSLCAASDPEVYKDLITFWDNVHGVDMSIMKRLIYSDVQIFVVKPDSIVSSSSPLTSIDLNNQSTKSSCVNFSSLFSLEITRDCVVNCLVAYFDTYFDLPEAVDFSTSPSSTPTHWKQSVFLLKKPIHLKQGEKLEGSLSCNRMESDSRSLDITIQIGDTTQLYQLQ